MKPNIPLSTHKLLSLLEYQTQGNFPNTIIVDQESVQILIQIEKDLEVFKAMGSDNCRILILNTRQNQQLSEEFGSNWFYFRSIYYNDFHSLCIYNKYGFNICISNKLYISQNPSEVILRNNLVEQLTHLRQCLRQTINWIVKDSGKEYISWIKRSMPKQLRTGVILRQKYYSIIGRNPRLIKREAEVQRIIAKAHPLKFQRMTLEIYIKYWSLCYRLLEGKKSFSGLSDLKLFTLYNNIGVDIQNYDLKSEEGFKLWEREAKFYHGFDLYYASFHLYPFKGTDGTWKLDITYSDCYWAQALKLIIELDKQHIHLSSNEQMLPRLKEQDLLFVSTSENVSDFYADQLEEEQVIGEPNVDILYKDPIHKKALIKATRWLDEPYPILKDTSSNTSQECSP